MGQIHNYEFANLTTRFLRSITQLITQLLHPATGGVATLPLYPVWLQLSTTGGKATLPLYPVAYSIVTTGCTGLILFHPVANPATTTGDAADTLFHPVAYLAATTVEYDIVSVSHVITPKCTTGFFATSAPPPVTAPIFHLNHLDNPL